MNTNAQTRNLYSEAFAATLRAERARRGLTQAEVAEAAGIKPVTYQRLESGARVITSAHLGDLAAALGLTLSEFVRRAEVTVGDLQAQTRAAEGKDLVKKRRAQ